MPLAKTSVTTGAEVQEQVGARAAEARWSMTATSIKMNPIIEESDSDASSNPNTSQITWGNDARSPVRNLHGTEESEKGDSDELSESLSSSGGLRQWLDYKTDLPTDSRKQQTIEIAFPFIKGFDPQNSTIKRRNSITAVEQTKRNSFIASSISNMDSSQSIDHLSDSSLHSDHSDDFFGKKTPVEAIYRGDVEGFDVSVLEGIAETSGSFTNLENLLQQVMGLQASSSKISFWEKIGFSDKRKLSNLLEQANDELEKTDQVWEEICGQQ